jgi:predicted alpha/beta-hydrolase family hydrolase
LRTAHFPQLQTPAIFVHGSRDPFGSLEELRQAIQLIPAETRLIELGGAGHELGRDHAGLAARIVSELRERA